MTPELLIKIKELASEAGKTPGFRGSILDDRLHPVKANAFEAGAEAMYQLLTEGAKKEWQPPDFKKVSAGMAPFMLDVSAMPPPPGSTLTASGEDAVKPIKKSRSKKEK